MFAKTNRQAQITFYVSLLLALSFFMTTGARAQGFNPVAVIAPMEFKLADGTTGVASGSFNLWDVSRTNWNANKTSDGNRYEHLIATNDYPLVAQVAVPLAPFNVSAADAKRYYDSKWSAYKAGASAGTATISHNCFGYSFGKTSIWINDEGPITTDDYDPAGTDGSAIVGVWDGGRHVVTISSYFCPDPADPASEPTVHSIIMKDRNSAIFSYTYTEASPWDYTVAPYYGGAACDLYKPE